MARKRRKHGGGVSRKVGAVRSAKGRQAEIDKLASLVAAHDVEASVETFAEYAERLGPMPDPPDDCSAETILIDELPPAMSLPAAVVVQLLRGAREQDLPLLIGEEHIALIDRHEEHQLSGFVRVFNGRSVDFVRCAATIRYRGVERFTAWIDIPTRYFGMIVSGSSFTPKTVSVDGEEVTVTLAEQRDELVQRARLSFPYRKPVWAGSFSFSKAWDEAAEIGKEDLMVVRHPDDSVELTPISMARMETIVMLDQAHVIRVEPEQVQVLPEWDTLEDAWEYASEAGLPFEVLYLDFEGPGGLAPIVTLDVPIYVRDEEKQGWTLYEVDTEQAHIHLRGAVVCRDGNGSLRIYPYGGIYYRDTDLPDVCVMMGVADFGTARVEPLGGHRVVLVGQGTVYGSEMAFVSTELLAGHPGHVSLNMESIKARTEVQADTTISFADLVLRASLRVLAALSIMETDCVVVDDAPMETRDRKRADKRGWEIAKMVYVRPTRKGPRSEPTGAEANYSHRFWVSGHYKHYPIGTRLADHRPDLVKPCTRKGDASCGVCRRVWTQPFIKGPENKPLIWKTLVKR